MTSPRFLVLCLALLACLGCGGTATVSGNVTYAGKPVERGRISFLPLDDKGELDAKSPVIGSDIADLVKDKKLEGISDLRDESSREGIRAVRRGGGEREGGRGMIRRCFERKIIAPVQNRC